MEQGVESMGVGGAAKYLEQLRERHELRPVGAATVSSSDVCLHLGAAAAKALAQKRAPSGGAARVQLQRAASFSVVNVVAAPLISSVSISSGSSSSSSQTDVELGNKCGKCQNHEVEVSKKGECKPGLPLVCVCVCGSSHLCLSVWTDAN